MLRVFHAKNDPKARWDVPRVSRAGDCIIKTRGLTKRFPQPRSWFPHGVQDKLAVDRVDLELSEGEIFGLVGPNGAGKTTLIRLLSTMVLPTSGVATVGGFDVVKAGREVRGLVGLVSSNERSFYWRLTGRQNLSFFGDLYQIPSTQARAWMEELLDLLDLGDIADVRFDRYSTGQRQRMAIARGLLSKPKILLMDEPTKGVDPVGAAQLVRIIRERVAQLWNPTILVTSHNLTEIERLCGRIALMAHGRIIALGKLHELRAMVEVANIYRMKVGHLAPETLEAIAAKSGPLQPVRVSCYDGTIDLEISFSRGQDRFARMIRAIIEAGGDVLTCSAVEASFDDVFHALLKDRTEADRNADGTSA